MAWENIVGGALQGIGAGLVATGKERAEVAAATAREDAAMRREIALANLGHQNKLTEDRAATENNMAENAHRSGLEVGAYGEKSKIDVAAYGSKSQIDTKSKLTLGQAETDNQIRIAKVKARLERDTSAEAATLRAQIEGGEVKDTIQGDDGNIYVVTKAGTVRNTGVKFRPKKSDVGGDDANPLKPTAANGGKPSVSNW